MSTLWHWELYHRRGPSPTDHVERVRAWPGVTVVNTQSHSLLVTAPAGFDQRIRPHLPDWAVRKVGRAPVGPVRADTRFAATNHPIQEC